MSSLHDVQKTAAEALRTYLDLTPVSLKHPLPERPLRSLGLVKMDGEVYRSEKLLRIVFMKISLPVYITIYSTFIRPEADYDLPVFFCEAVCMGSKRIFMLDIHFTGEEQAQKEKSPFFDLLVDIRGRFPELLEFEKKVGGDEIQGVRSRAACQFKLKRDMDDSALRILREYAFAYGDLVRKAQPLEGDALAAAKKGFEAYLETVVEHDPGVKVNSVLFGKKGGVERAMDIYFGRFI